MQFKDVELARKKYYDKDQEILKKCKKITAIVCAILLLIEIPIFIAIFQQSKNILTLAYLPIMIIIVIIVAMTETFFVYSIVHLFMRRDNKNLFELYLAYKRTYKAFFVHHQLSQFFTDLDYNHDNSLDKKLLEETGLIYTGDIYKSNDLVKGKYKNNAFIQADVEITDVREERDKDGHVNTRYITVFKGRYLIFEFPKKFDFKMIVSHQNDLINSIKAKRGWSKIETESPDFNARFSVYAEDGFEAFYILDPAFIDNLDKLGQKYNNKLSLYFFGNKLYVGLNDNNDAFEPPDPSSPINERKEEDKVANDMKLITNLVDELKLSK
ncbi:DUF3137 domain-containing protein [Candidatus Saccharibacteria bacterium]|nr:DUF3137 domain-containing protein [Candidatus Saccharibacteria bacterium]